MDWFRASIGPCTIFMPDTNLNSLSLWSRFSNNWTKFACPIIGIISFRCRDRCGVLCSCYSRNVKHIVTASLPPLKILQIPGECSCGYNCINWRKINEHPTLQTGETSADDIAQSRYMLNLKFLPLRRSVQAVSYLCITLNRVRSLHGTVCHWT